MLIKKAKILHSNEEHSMMVDPFVQPMTEALNSEHIPVLIESLMCMNFLLKFRGMSQHAGVTYCPYISLSIIP